MSSIRNIVVDESSFLNLYYVESFLERMVNGIGTIARNFGTEDPKARGGGRIEEQPGTRLISTRSSLVT